MRWDCPVLRWRLCALICASLSVTMASAATVVGRVEGRLDVSPLGTASYRVPLAVAAGPGPLRPDVALVYDSRGGDGLAGIGWTLAGFSAIRRCPLTRAVDGQVRGVRLDREDRYCLDGQPLVLMSGVHAQDGAEYRTELDDFRRVRARGTRGPGPAWFEVEDPDGRVWAYGKTADSRIDLPDAETVTREWAVSEVRDRFDNRIVYSYLDADTHGERLPAELRWSVRADGQPTRFRLRFEYAERPAADQRTGYQWGHPVRRLQRLAQIHYETDAAGGFETVYRYVPGYANSSGGTRRSRLGSLRQCGPRDCLPPTRFSWQTGTPGFANAVAGPSDVGASAAVFGDQDGDGDADLFVPGDQRWQLRLSEARAPNPVGSVTVDTGQPVRGPGYPLDFDGDGRTDLLTPGPDGSWVVLVSTAPGEVTRVDTGIAAAGIIEPVPLDLDGDGRSDLIYVRDQTRVVLRRNTGAGFGAEQPSGAPTGQSGDVIRLRISDGSLRVADFDGDGRHDLLMMRRLTGAGSISWWQAHLSSGAGFDSEPMRWDGLAHPAVQLVVLDINGDGLTDLAYQEQQTGAWWTTLSTGRSFADAQPTGITTPADVTLVAVDYEGDGREDVLRPLDDSTWRIHLASSGIEGPPFSDADPSRYVDLSGGPAPASVGRLVSLDLTADGYVDLLMSETGGRWQSRRRRGVRADLVTGIADGLGLAQAITYASLSDPAAYAADAPFVSGDGRLLAGGSQPLVRSVVVSGTGVAAYALDYHYQNARQSLRGRGFLGFERQTVTDHRTGMVTTQEFRPEFPYRGRAFRRTRMTQAGRLVHDARIDWASHVRDPATGEPASGVHWVYAGSELLEEYETDAQSAIAGQLVRTTRRDGRLIEPEHGMVVRETATVSSPQGEGWLTQTTALTLDESLRLGAHCLGRVTREEVTSSIDGGPAERRTRAYAYDAQRCALLSELSGPASDPAQQRRTRYAYTSSGQLSAVTTDAADGMTTPRRRELTYAPGTTQPDIISHVSPDEPALRFEYAWDHARDAELDALAPWGAGRTRVLDDFGRLASETTRDGRVITLSRHLCTAIACPVASAAYGVVLSRSDGFSSSSFRDALGREVASSFVLADGRDSLTLTEFDALGRPARRSRPHVPGEPVFWRTTSYDLDNRPVRDEQPASELDGAMAVTSWRYDGLSVTQTDPAQAVTTFRHDARGLLVEVSAALGSHARYRYTPFGELAVQATGGWPDTVLERDAHGRLVRLSDPDLGQRAYTYNVFGEIVAIADAAIPPNVISVEYDALGRRARRTDGAEGTTQWLYGAAANTGHGLLRQVVGPVGTNATGFDERYDYDAHGRLLETTTRIDGVSYRTTRAYNAQGQLSELRYPPTINGGRPTFAQAYQHGYLVSIHQDLGGGLLMPVYALTEMDAAGHERAFRQGGSGLGSALAYDRASGRLTGIRTGFAGTADVQDYAYAWDLRGNLTSREDRGQGLVEEFTYDALGRMSGVQRNGQPALTLRYDSYGNLTYKSDTGDYAYGERGAGPHALTTIAGPRSTTYDYDANGNLVCRDGTTSGCTDGYAMRWSAFGLPAVTAGPRGSASFFYGPNRQPIKQLLVSAGAVRTFHHVGPHFEREVEGATLRFRSRLFANGRVVYSQVEHLTSSGHGATTGIEAYFVHYDHLGSVDRLTRQAGSGANRLALSFDAFGKRRETDWTSDTDDSLLGSRHWTRRGFAGHEHIDVAGLVRMNGRLLDPVSGRMLSADPWLGELRDPQSLNRYSYAVNRPVVLTDPTGLAPGQVKNTTGPDVSRVRPPVPNIFVTAPRLDVGNIASVGYGTERAGPLGAERRENAMPGVPVPGPGPSDTAPSGAAEDGLTCPMQGANVCGGGSMFDTLPDRGAFASTYDAPEALAMALGPNGILLGVRPLRALGSFWINVPGGVGDRTNLELLHMQAFFTLDGVLLDRGLFSPGVITPDPGFPGNIGMYRFGPAHPVDPARVRSTLSLFENNLTPYNFFGIDGCNCQDFAEMFFNEVLGP